MRGRPGGVKQVSYPADIGEASERDKWGRH